MPSNDSYPQTNIINPGPNDILCGRGGGTNAHPGNIKFRKLVAAHKLRYLAASKSDKPGVARDVVREWRSMDPPGRFLAKMDGQVKPSGDDDDRPVLWYDVGDKKSREKASQCLRERNGAANEAVAALVKTVTASGEACPEDYATLMNKAAMVKAQNELTIQQQNQMIKMGQQAQQHHHGMGRHHQQNNIDMRGKNNYCQEAFEPILLQHQQHNEQGYVQGGNNYHDSHHNSEDDLIEAEIQRLLQQRQQQLIPNKNNLDGSSVGCGGGGSSQGGNSMLNNACSVGGMPNNRQNDFSGMPQPYMGEESVMREYEQLMQKQRELNMMAGKMNSMMGRNSHSGMNGGMNNNMGGMMNGGMNNNMGMVTSNNMNNMGAGMMTNNMGGMRMPQAAMSNSNMGVNNYVGAGMASNRNPDAAKDYMNRLRMLRQAGGGANNSNQGSGVSVNNRLPDQTSSCSGYSNGYSGNNGNNNAINNMMQGKSGGEGPEFTIEEYQASLQQFLSHNDDFGDSADSSPSKVRADIMISRQANQDSPSQYNSNSNNNAMSGTLHCIQVPTNLEDGSSGNKRNRRSSLRSVDDMDLPLGRNTFKSVDSTERPSFQSMDDMDIRGTFRSVDTMDLMSIGNSINEIMEEDVKHNGPEVRKKYGRRLSAASRHSKQGANNGNNPSLNDFTHLAGETVEIKTMDHGRASGTRGGGGPKKKKGAIDPRLLAQAGTRHSVQTKDCDGPTGGARGSQLSIKDLNLEGVDDASRMSFGNMSVMSELTDFQEMMTKGHGDSSKLGDTFNHM